MKIDSVASSVRPASNRASETPSEAKSGRRFDIVVLGLSLSSSWGNGHATTYRSLLREMHRRGHRVTFLERDVPWYASNRDLATAPYCRLALYDSVDELREQFGEQIRSADVVIIGSFVPDGVEVAKWVLKTARGATAFYDIDTPVTLAKIGRGDYEYISPELIPEFDLYLSFTGGPTLDRLESEFGAQAARALFCSVDPDAYYPDGENQRDGEESAGSVGSAGGGEGEGGMGGGGEFQYDLGYLGTYSEDRQPRLERRMLDAARRWPDGRFIVVGPGYPAEIRWPSNVGFSPHLPPSEHRQFYTTQRFTLNITRVDMVRVGYAPSVRLFEAAACGTPIISDYWEGIETLFEPGREILISHCGEDTLRHLRYVSDEERRAIGRRARARVLSAHTAAHRARELEGYLTEVMEYSDALGTR